MNNPSIPKSEKEQEIDIIDNFKAKLRELLLQEHKNFKDVNTLLWLGIKCIFDVLDAKGAVKINTEYQDTYPALMLKYAQTNINPDGFYGEYKIDVSKINEWAQEHDEWRKTLLLIPRLTENLINRNLEKIVQSIENSTPSIDLLKLSAQLTVKCMDLQYRLGKDSGQLKDDKRDIDKLKSESAININNLDKSILLEALGE
jgi:hypothetical protein